MSNALLSIDRILVILLIIGLSCTPKSENDPPSSSIDVVLFGNLPDGSPVDMYTLRNENKFEVQVITYGGIITSIKWPNQQGGATDIVLGYDELSEYVAENPYFGAIIGRYGNRIAKGRFQLDSVEYTLATNNLGNHLHGGITGFDKVNWQGEPVYLEDGSGVKLSYTSQDMEEGYPGKLSVEVTYLLKDDNSLTFEYSASTDRKTIINLTNHSYYNLSGSNQDILDHQLLINASTYLPVDSTLIPMQIDSVAGTPFDFRAPKTIGQDIDARHIQLENGGGYDHCWVIEEDTNELKLAAALYHPASGRYMEVHTTEPGIQFYSGNFLDGSITGKNQRVYGYRSGLCLETQHFPDSPNRPDFPSVVLNPGDKYSSKTVTKFSNR